MPWSITVMATDFPSRFAELVELDESRGFADEMFEGRTPLRLLRPEYLVGSAGRGRCRGGLGVITEFVRRDRSPL